jgi:hypothetical protein
MVRNGCARAGHLTLYGDYRHFDLGIRRRHQDDDFDVSVGTGMHSGSRDFCPARPWREHRGKVRPGQVGPLYRFEIPQEIAYLRWLAASEQQELRNGRQ